MIKIKSDSESRHGTPFSLQEAIILATGLNLPIEGGTGLYFDDPIIINEPHHATAIDVEQAVAETACVFYGFWRAEKGDVETLHIDSHTYDAISYDYVNNNDHKMTTTLYFDITLPYSNVGKTRAQVYTPEELRRDRYAIDESKIIPHFYAAVFWALQSVMSGPNRKGIDVPDIMGMFTVGHDEAAQIKKGLESCGALDDRSRGLVERYLNSSKK